MKLIGCVILTAALAFGQASPEVQIKAAIHKEQVEGDIKGAIEAYRKVAARQGVGPDIASQALYRIGQCQEKLGQAEARKSYERVVKEYGKQAAAVQARARLTALGTHGVPGEQPRLLWADAPRDLWGTSADGRWVSFTDPVTHDLALRDLTAGTSRRVTNQGILRRSSAVGSVVSRDGERIAYLWADYDQPDGEQVSLKTIRADGTGERVLSRLQKNLWIQPLDWSPDGEWIAVRKGFAGETGWRIVLIGANDGREREIVSRETLRRSFPGRMAFSPDGRWLAYAAPSQSGHERGGAYGVHLVSLAEAAAPPAEVVADARLAGWAPKGDALLVGRATNGQVELLLQPVASGRAAGAATKVRSMSGFSGSPLAVTSNGSVAYFQGNRSWDALVADLDLNANAVGKTVVTRPASSYGWYNMGGGARISPDGKRVLLTTADERLVIRPLDGGGESTLQPRLKSSYRFEWAADGESLLISGTSPDGRTGLYRVDARSGATSLVAPDDGRAVSFTAFAPAPDGKTVYFLTPDGISSLDLATAAIRWRVVQHPGYVVMDLRVSRDGRRLALLGAGAVDAADLTTGKIQQVARTPGSYMGGDWSPDDQHILANWLPGSHDEDLPTELVKLPLSGGPSTRASLGGGYIGLRLSADGKKITMSQRHAPNRQIWILDHVLGTGK